MKIISRIIATVGFCMFGLGACINDICVISLVLLFGGIALMWFGYKMDGEYYDGSKTL